MAGKTIVVHGKIEQDVAIPTPITWRWPKWEILDDLKVGDSISFDLDAPYLNAPTSYRKLRDKKGFSVRQMGIGKCRVWRLK